MKITRKITLITLALPLVGAIAIGSVGVRAGSDDQFVAAAAYKTNKCNVCHGANAEKKFDSTKSDDENTQAILKGKKMEKPPNMPAFEEKGITADQAKAMVAYMRSLKQ